ncbi:hypothetical protein ACO0LC_05615 [Undibacterium sp. JH2W]|uniref:hypothetical protein n=1 Tax=Undibacterium sp. JH2W TaxID=3413037 RepID=UPI003BF27AE8
MKTTAYAKDGLLLRRHIIINGSTLENFRENLKIFSIYFHTLLTATNCENFRVEIKKNSKKITRLQQVILFEFSKWLLKQLILTFIASHTFL